MRRRSLYWTVPSTNECSQPHRLFSRPADRSLVAYKEWIRGMYEALMTQASLPVEEDDMTKEEWVSSWKNFWKGAEKETRQE